MVVVVLVAAAMRCQLAPMTTSGREKWADRQSIGTRLVSQENMEAEHAHTHTPKDPPTKERPSASTNFAQAGDFIGGLSRGQAKTRGGVN